MSTASPKQTQTAKPQAVSNSKHAGMLLQRKCACGSPTSSLTGSCPECQSKKMIQTKLSIGASNDPLEREADRVADQVVANNSPSSVSSLAFGRLQREEAPKEKTNEEKYQEGLEKLGKAFLKTPLGKELLEKIKQDTLVKGATELGKDFISTWSGKIVTGAAASGAVAALAATHKALPAQIPEIPLDVLTPGLSVQLTYKGPVDKPTEAMITFKFTEQAPKGRDDKKPMSATDKFRAETARLAAENAKFRAGMTYEPGSPEDLQQKAGQEGSILKYSGGPNIEATSKKHPWLATLQPKTGLQLTMPKPSFGIKPPALLSDELKLKSPSEQKKKEDEPALQKKLSIGASNDPLEEEADRIADQVLAAPARPAASGAPQRIQRFTGQADEGTETAPASVDRVLASSGRPMEPSLQQDMEQRFGHDFSRVRVHSGGAAEQSARDVNANAYTVGHDVVFGAGRFAPETHEGRRLIAHELAHVVQQSGSDEIRVGKGNEKCNLSPIARKHATSLAREADPDREWQAACVRRLGGCATSRDGGLPNVEEINTYNLECRKETGYSDNVTPSEEECKTAKEHSNAPLSYELADAPRSSDPKVRVERWLRDHRSEIEAAETKFNVDRRAIAGAIAWEAIENVRSAWTPSSVGPGKVHIYKDLAKGTPFSEDTVAKQVEDKGYLPKQDLAGRKNVLRTSSGAIRYIAAIMEAGADIALEEGGFEIALNPEVLTWYYNSKDLPGWGKLIKAKQRGTTFDTSQNDMSVWVKANLAFLEAAVGKPSLRPTVSPKLKLQKAPLNPDVTGTPPRIQRYTGQASGQMDYAPTSVDRVLASSGKPLEPALKQDMEQRFGHDFSRVRVHSSAAAEQSAREVNANAYTVGHNIVFGAGRFTPAVHEGRRLIAHELTHVMQQGNGSFQPENRVDREVDDDEEEQKRRAVASQQADASGQATTMASKDVGTATINSPTADADALSPEQSKSVADTVPIPVDPAKRNAAPSTQTQTPSAQPNVLTTASAVTLGGHTAAPKDMASCPDAPGRNLVVLVCSDKAAVASTTVEKAELPKPNPARFGGDADRAKFAKDLAQCHAVRIVNDEIDKRYRVDVAAAKKQATDQSKSDREAAIKAATEGIDPNDKGAIGRAKTQATADAKKVAEKMIVDAQTAVSRQDIATVTAELAAKFEDALAADYDETVKGAFSRFGSSWLRTMQSVLNSKRKQITKEKSAKPKAAKNETPPPAKSADQIAGEIAAEMVEIRCDQRQWALGELEAVSHAWAVGRREQVDFETVPQKAVNLSKFGPTYDPAAKDRVDIPVDIQEDKGMPGVAPEMSDFLTQLKADPSTPTFKASNYGGHGGGSWAGKGFSVDLTITVPTDQRGFWQHSTAVTFLLRLDATAKAWGARWRVLYNDFRVAQEVNAATGMRNVEFIGTSGGGQLNWHGPAPLILHFHLDLEIPQRPSAPPSGTP